MRGSRGATRVTLSYDATADGVRADAVIEELLRQVAVAV